MPYYIYKAINKQGEIVKGKAAFIDEQHLFDWLKNQGLTLVNFKKSLLDQIFRPKIKEQELIEFSRQVYYIVKSGIPIIQGLYDLKNTTHNKQIKQIIDTLINEIEGGKSFADALRLFPTVFPKFYVSIVETGEASGTLDNSFKELTNYLSWLYNIKSKVKQAFIYPTIVSCIVAIAIVVFIVYVIPQLVKFLTQLDMELPWTTKLLIFVNDLVTKYWYIIIGFIASIVGILFFSRYSDKLLLQIDKIKTKIPYIGNILTQLIMLRFVKYLGILYKAGVNILDALEMVKEILSNRFYEEKIESIKNYINSGYSLGDSIERSKDFPLLLQRSIKIGESTGNLEHSLDELANYYDEELERAIRKLISIIEPGLLIFVAIIIIVIIVSVLAPIYNAIGKIK